MIKNVRGQAVLESVMLMAVILVVWIGVTSALKKTNFFQKIFGNSWARLSNTIEFGIPVAERSKAASLHPTSFDRHSSVKNE